MKYRDIFAALALGAISFAIFSTSAPRGSKAEPSAEPFRIGVTYGFTGAAARWSMYGQMGIELARDEINARGGINGRPLEIIYADSKTNPRESVSAYRKLVSVDKVDAVVGSIWSILTNPLIPLTRKDKVPLISPTVMDASVEVESPYFYTLGNRVSSLRDPIREFYRLHPEIQSVAFLCWEDAWGMANLKIWKEIAEERGIAILDTICQGDHTNDFRIDVTRIVAKKPDAVFVGMYPERVVARLKEQNFDATVFTTSCVLEAVDTREPRIELLEGMYFAYWPANKAFSEAFRQKFNRPPVLEAHNHYEVVMSIARAAQRAPGDVSAGLEGLHYAGSSGPIDFRKAPFANRSPGVLMKISSGYQFAAVERGTKSFETRASLRR